MEERVVLVDENDHPIGEEEKLAAHRDGKLHRAFSVFVFDVRGHILLQQRSIYKYHSRLLWSNTCCGHPRPGEGVAAAARRRLREEMGLDCSLESAGTFTYRAELEDGLVENEIDHVLVGRATGNPVPAPDPSEVAAWRWCEVESVTKDVAENPSIYTAWFAAALEALRQSGSADQ